MPTPSSRRTNPVVRDFLSAYRETSRIRDRMEREKTVYNKAITVFTVNPEISNRSSWR
ncbi:hypothetical protein D3C81_2031690 [compost metagenome]